MRAVFRSGFHEGGGTGARKGAETPPRVAGSKRPPRERRTRRGGKRSKPSGAESLSDDTTSEKEDSGKKARRPSGRCAWPGKPRLPDDKFKEFRSECRKACPESCFAFLVGTCRDASCTRPHEVTPAFEAVKEKFR